MTCTDCGCEFSMNNGQKVPLCIKCRNARTLKRQQRRGGHITERFEVRGWIRMQHIVQAYNPQEWEARA